MTQGGELSSLSVSDHSAVDFLQGTDSVLPMFSFLFLYENSSDKARRGRGFIDTRWFVGRSWV